MKITNYIIRNPLPLDYDIFNFIVRSKLDLLELIASVLEILLDTNRVVVDAVQTLAEKNLKISIVVSKMRRIFLISHKKYVSFYFPFNIDNQKDRDIIFIPEAKIIDHAFISSLRSTLQEIKNRNGQALESCIDLILDADEQDASFWSIFSYLLQMDDGYLRYDHDVENMSEDYHPEYHLDIFYSQSTTFKLGLKNRLTECNLQKILNIKDFCSYIEIK